MSKDENEEGAVRELPRRAKRLRRAYTKLSSMGVGDESYSALLVVGVQQFTVVEGRTKEQAEWYRDQLAIALHHLLNFEAT